MFSLYVNQLIIRPSRRPLVSATIIKPVLGFKPSPFRFSPNKFGGGAYLTVNKNVGSLIDWVRLIHRASLSTTSTDYPLVQRSVLQPYVLFIQNVHALFSNVLSPQRDLANTPPATICSAHPPALGPNRPFSRLRHQVFLFPRLSSESPPPPETRTTASCRLLL